MPYTVRYGYPDIEKIMEDLLNRKNNDELDEDDLKCLKKIVKCLNLLSQNPRHPSLSSHKIDVLSKEYGVPVWESYLENHTPTAGRIFWVYGPEQSEITIAAIEPHPERNAYSRVKLTTKPKPPEKKTPSKEEKAKPSSSKAKAQPSSRKTTKKRK